MLLYRFFHSQESEMTSNRFSTLSNSALKVVNGKNYSKVENILEVNNDVAVKI